MLWRKIKTIWSFEYLTRLFVGAVAGDDRVNGDLDGFVATVFMPDVNLGSRGVT
jgi:hypothetical protein